MNLRNTILTNVTATAIVIVFIFADLRVRHLRERMQSDALYVVALQAYERVVAVKDADWPQFYSKYKEAGAAYEALNDFDIGHPTGEVERRDRNLLNCIDAFLVRRSPTISQAIKARLEQQIQQCAIDPTLGTSARRK